ncbi:MAG TPA: FHA domain-containing protein, partial [Thermoanaerobaculia bacterium]|nr:FHA domain-containing protein [Thermoanaerobaculia bacterium]
MRTRDTTRTVLFADVQAAVSEASLVLIYGANDLGKRFELKKDITIGRDRSNDIVIEAQDVSRQHARVERRENAEWWITDLASRNGTRRNGEPLKGTVTLVNGDLIAIGGVMFKYIGGGNVEALFHEEIYRMTISDALT